MALSLARSATPVLLQRVISSLPSSQSFSFPTAHKLVFSQSSSFQHSLSSSSFLSPTIPNHPHPGYCQSSFPNQYTYESSDFEADEWDQDEIDMVSILKILFEVKELPTEKETLGVLEESGVPPTENLIFCLLLRLKMSGGWLCWCSSGAFLNMGTLALVSKASHDLDTGQK